jgi:hypothetical protein
MNIQVDNIDIINKNVEETNYMLVSREQNADQNEDINIINISFGNISQLKYLRTTVTEQNVIQE